MTSAYFFGWDYTINKQEKTTWQLVNRKADFFTKRIDRIDSHIESNRIDSNRELECSSPQHMNWTDLTQTSRPTYTPVTPRHIDLLRTDWLQTQRTRSHGFVSSSHAAGKLATLLQLDSGWREHGREKGIGGRKGVYPDRVWRSTDALENAVSAQRQQMEKSAGQRDLCAVSVDVSSASENSGPRCLTLSSIPVSLLVIPSVDSEVILLLGPLWNLQLIDWLKHRSRQLRGGSLRTPVDVTAVSVAWTRLDCMRHRCKNVFYVAFYFGHTFFYFPDVFYF